MHRKLSDLPVVGVAVDFDGTALGFGQFFTEQFLSRPLLLLLMVLQSQNQFSYYDCTHRGMISVGNFYEELAAQWKSDIQFLNKQGYHFNIKDYRTYRVVKNLAKALQQHPAAVSTSDDRVFFEEKEQEPILGSGFEKLALYEKAGCPPLEEFKKAHAALRVTPFKDIINKNRQYTSIAKHFVAANRDYLNENPDKKVRLIAIDDVEDILVDGLRHSIDSADWPKSVAFTPIYVVTFPEDLKGNDRLSRFLSLPENAQLFAPIFSGTREENSSDSFFSTHVFQPFFVCITLSNDNHIQYYRLSTFHNLGKELENIRSSRKQEAKVPIVPTPERKIQASSVQKSKSVSHAKVQVALSSGPESKAELALIPTLRNDKPAIKREEVLSTGGSHLILFRSRMPAPSFKNLFRPGMPVPSFGHALSGHPLENSASNTISSVQRGMGSSLPQSLGKQAVAAQGSEPSLRTSLSRR